MKEQHDEVKPKRRLRDINNPNGRDLIELFNYKPSDIRVVADLVKELGCIFAHDGYVVVLSDSATYAYDADGTHVSCALSSRFEFRIDTASGLRLVSLGYLNSICRHVIRDEPFRSNLPELTNHFTAGPMQQNHLYRTWKLSVLPTPNTVNRA